MIARVAAAALVGVLAGLGVAAAGASPASAHASEVGTSPEDGAVLDAAPATVAVEFDTPILDIGAAIVVRSAEGTAVTVGAPRLERQRIAVDVDPDAVPGDYTVAYRVVAEDGHTIESTFGYTVAGRTPAAPAPATPAPATPASAAPAAAAPSDAGSSPPYLLIGAGVLAILLVAAGALALRR